METSKQNLAIRLLLQLSDGSCQLIYKWLKQVYHKIEEEQNVERL